MEKNSCEIDFYTEDELVDYPYIGIGNKPKKNKIDYNYLEKIIGF